MEAILITMAWLVTIMIPTVAFAVVEARRARDEAQLEAEEARYVLNQIHKQLMLRKRRR